MDIILRDDCWQWKKLLVPVTTLIREPFVVYIYIYIYIYVYMRRLHNEELNDLCSSPNIVRVIKSKRMRWAGHVARMGEERGVYRVLVGKPEGKRPLGRPRRRWVDNIRMDLHGWHTPALNIS